MSSFLHLNRHWEKLKIYGKKPDKGMRFNFAWSCKNQMFYLLLFSSFLHEENKYLVNLDNCLLQERSLSQPLAVWVFFGTPV